MLEYGSPALPAFYSRALLFGNVEYRIQNHRRTFPFRFHPPTAMRGGAGATAAAAPAPHDGAGAGGEPS
jgi:hypothetical protein